MLQALSQRICALPDFKPRLRYLAAAPRRDMLAPLRNQPELHAWLAADVLVPVLWDPERGDPCLLLLAGRQAWRPANPVAVLAQDRWRTLPQRLLAVHYGALLEADLAQSARGPQGGASGRLWRPAARLPNCAAFGQAVECYLSHFNSAPVPLPEGALGAIERIAALAQRGYLVLAAAPGFISERDMRLCEAGRLVNEQAARQPLPINFHLLAQHYRALGAASRELELRQDLALQLALGAVPDQDARLSRIASVLTQGGMGDATALADAMRIAAASGARGQTLLTLLRQSGHDPRVFLAAGKGMPAVLQGAIACQREAWSETLEQVWQHHLPASNAPLLHRELAPAAMRSGNWELARRALRRGMAAHGEHAEDLALLAWIEMRTGRIPEAEELSRRALTRDPGNPTAREVAARLAARLANWDGAWRAPIRHPSLPLTLEPLDASHAPALHYQYRDPQIGIMAGLPPLATEDEASHWIVHHAAEAGRQAYAIMHADHGFVGYVCLAVAGEEAYFCFWIGVDFQGRRLAGEAGRMLCGVARGRRIATIFTSVYDDNVRSIRTLERIGFRPLALRALPPEHDRRFFYMRTGEREQREWKEGDPATELVAYYRRENLPIAFGPDAAGDAARPTCAMMSN